MIEFVILLCRLFKFRAVDDYCETRKQELKQLYVLLNQRFWTRKPIFLRRLIVVAFYFHANRSRSAFPRKLLSRRVMDLISSLQLDVRRDRRKPLRNFYFGDSGIGNLVMVCRYLSCLGSPNNRKVKLETIFSSPSRDESGFAKNSLFPFKSLFVFNKLGVFSWRFFALFVCNSGLNLVVRHSNFHWLLFFRCFFPSSTIWCVNDSLNLDYSKYRGLASHTYDFDYRVPEACSYATCFKAAFGLNDREFDSLGEVPVSLGSFDRGGCSVIVAPFVSKDQKWKQLDLGIMAKFGSYAASLLGESVTILGGESDRDECRSFERYLEQYLNRDSIISMVGCLNICKSFDVIKSSALIVTNDTFALHMGVLTGSRVICFVGPSDKDRSLPKADGVLYLANPCDCNTSTVDSPEVLQKLVTCGGKCMAEWDDSRLFNEIRGFLDNRS